MFVGSADELSAFNYFCRLGWFQMFKFNASMSREFKTLSVGGGG